MLNGLGVNNFSKNLALAGHHLGIMNHDTFYQGKLSHTPGKKACANMIKAVLFDFGGVLAEEGFKQGLRAIAKERGLDPEDFYEIAGELVYQMGYVMGSSDEKAYWNAFREKTGVRGEDKEFREEILKRFELRPDMMEVVEKMRSSGLIVAILSDQTNWLDELDQRTPFHHHFDYVFNSFHLKKTKRSFDLQGYLLYFRCPTGGRAFCRRQSGEYKKGCKPGFKDDPL
jgi:putative hydrolase of the HAD superfamily